MKEQLKLEAIKVCSIISETHPSDPKYAEYVSQLETIVSMIKGLDKEAPVPWLDRVLENSALLSLLGNLAISVLILNHERLHVITSRAFTFVRPK